MCRAVIDFCARSGLYVWVDPKKDDWEAYRGAYAITPNMKELAAAAGRSVDNEDCAVADAASELASRYEIENISTETLVVRNLQDSPIFQPLIKK